MSASSKKKLRNAQDAAKMTEKQLAEQKEAKQLKIYTTVFVVVLALMVCFAVYTAVSKTISHSGVMERNTVALTVGDHEISNAELNYYFMASVNSFYSQYGSHASLFGLDLTQPLDEQVLDEESGYTWADNFMDEAIANVQAVYALTDAADAAGYTLSEDEIAYVDNQIAYMDLYAIYNGYSETEDYLKAMYGNGATSEGFRDYYLQTTLASSYQSSYTSALTYDDAAIAAEDEANASQYTYYSYNYTYLNANYFLTGGTTDEEGNTTYSDEEKAAALKACEEAAKELAAGEYATAEDFDAAVAALSINAEEQNAMGYTYTDVKYASVLSALQEWVTDSSRQAGETTYVPYTTHTHADGETHSEDEDSSAYDTVNGYYVGYFVGSNDNNYPLANVRHILVAFEGGTYDSTTGTTTYTDDEKAATLAAAEELLNTWQSGEATEDSFAALANENSADSDGTDGGLYEDVYPGQMVTNFNDWCFEEGRQPGDTGIVESEYGYHIMFYSGDSETLYREYLITSALRSADAEEWYNALVEAMTVTEKNTKYVNTDLVLSNG